MLNSRAVRRKSPVKASEILLQGPVQTGLEKMESHMMKSIWKQMVLLAGLFCCSELAADDVYFDAAPQQSPVLADGIGSSPEERGRIDSLFLFAKALSESPNGLLTPEAADIQCQAFCEILAADPGNAAVLGRLLSLYQEYPETVKVYEKRIREIQAAHPAEPGLAYFVAIFLDYFEGRTEESLKLLKDCIIQAERAEPFASLSPESPDFWLRLDLLTQLFRMEESVNPEAEPVLVREILYSSPYLGQNVSAMVL